MDERQTQKAEHFLLIRAQYLLSHSSIRKSDIKGFAFGSLLLAKALKCPCSRDSLVQKDIITTVIREFALLVVLEFDIRHLNLVVSILLSNCFTIYVRSTDGIAVVLLPINVYNEIAEDEAQISIHTNRKKPIDSTAAAKVSKSSVGPVNV